MTNKVHAPEDITGIAAEKQSFSELPESYAF